MWTKFKSIVLRQRNLTLIGGSLLVLGLMLYTDPDNGALTAIFLQNLTKPIIAVWFSFLATNAVFDYARGRELYKLIETNAIAAGLFFIARAIVLLGVLLLFSTNASAQSIDTYIPTKANTYMPVVVSEQVRLWPDHPKEICWVRS